MFFNSCIYLVSYSQVITKIIRDNHRIIMPKCRRNNIIDFKHMNITDFICLVKWGEAVPDSVRYLMCLTVSIPGWGI